MTPIEAYHQKIRDRSLQIDPQQTFVIEQLQRIYDALLIPKKRIFSSSLKGLYIWGPVGRGKTCLMDLFYTSLPLPKLRQHFHHFMRFIHSELTTRQGQKDPLKQIAQQLSREVRVICLDEFLVHDIADAILLSTLLSSLFQQRNCLIITSNTAPKDLYRGGVQRERFLNAITLIEKNLSLVHLNGPTDYRQHSAKGDEPEITDPLFILSASTNRQIFEQLKKEATIYHPLTVHHRSLSHLGYTNHIIWFDFQTLCSEPRSPMDYLVLSQRFPVFLISGLIPIKEQDDNKARLFIHLIDILYDASTTLILSANRPISAIYPKGRLLAEFQRTQSRLLALKRSADPLINTVLKHS